MCQKYLKKKVNCYETTVRLEVVTVLAISPFLLHHRAFDFIANNCGKNIDLALAQMVSQFNSSKPIVWHIRCLISPRHYVF